MKRELEEEYKKFKEINSDDEYSKTAVVAGEIVMRLLDEGKTPKEAVGDLDGLDLTGYMVGIAIQAVVHFHERGEELRVWWNDRYGVKTGAGTVNPALMTIEI